MNIVDRAVGTRDRPGAIGVGLLIFLRLPLLHVEDDDKTVTWMDVHGGTGVALPGDGPPGAEGSGSGRGRTP